VPEPQGDDFNRHEDNRVEELLRQLGWPPQKIAIDRPAVSENREELRQEKLQRFWEENPEAHVALFGGTFNPFTGAVNGGEIFERQHNWPPHTAFDPASFPKGFLDWLKTEMKYNPEMKEKR
jgi:hypothetical protein